MVAERIAVTDGGEQSRIDLSQVPPYVHETNSSVLRTLNLAVDRVLKRSVVLRLDVPNRANVLYVSDTEDDVRRAMRIQDGNVGAVYVVVLPVCPAQH